MSNVPYSRIAKSIGLRTILRSRATTLGIEGMVSGGYPGGTHYYGDVIMQARAFAGYWTTARLKPLVDDIAASVGADDGSRGQVTPEAWVPASGRTVDLAGVYWANPNGFFYRIPGPSGPNQPLAMPGWFAWFVDHLYRAAAPADKLGIYNLYRAKLLTALGGMPTKVAGGGILVNVTNAINYGFDYQDGLTGLCGGGIANASVWTGWAYGLLGAMATAEGDTATATICTNKRTDLTNGLSTLLDASGWFKASDDASANGNTMDLWSSAMIAAERLCTVGQATAIATLLVGTSGILKYGCLRQILSPGYWPSNLWSPGYFQNGGWTLFFTHHVERALRLNGQASAAQDLMVAAVREVVREERADPQTAPWEAVSETSGHAHSVYGSGSAVLEVAVDTDPGYIDLAVDGAYGSVSEVAVPLGHGIMGARLLAAGASTMEVTVEACGEVNTINSDAVGSRTAWATIGTVQLAGEVERSALVGFVPRYCWGGWARVRVSGGAGVGQVVCRLYTLPVIPSFTGAATTPLAVPPGFILDTGSVVYDWTDNPYTVDAVIGQGGATLRGPNGAAVAGPSTAGQHLTYYLDPTGIGDPIVPDPPPVLRDTLTIQLADGTYTTLQVLG